MNALLEVSLWFFFGIVGILVGAFIVGKFFICSSHLTSKKKENKIMTGCPAEMEDLFGKDSRGE